MINNRILLVGGNFDRNGGRSSSLICKVSQYLTKEDITVYNGGHIEALREHILPSVKDYNIVLWMPNVPNDEEKIRNVKEINPKTILISSKRNDNGKYQFSELINRALMQKSNLVIEFSKVEEKLFHMMVFDPLGSVYYQGTEIKEMTKALFERAKTLTAFTRIPSVQISEEKPEVPEKEEFFNFARSCSDIFHNLINPDNSVTRFLGNMSFRCQNGFPSFRGENGTVYVSKRNVDKREIQNSSFVPVKLAEDGKTLYYGKDKPSVDTPIQLRLYQEYPFVNFMIHAHCYFKDAPFTARPIPCGAVEEVEEIKKVMSNIKDKENKDLVAINLLGHGCILFAKNETVLTNLKTKKNNNFIARQMPEAV